MRIVSSGLRVALLAGLVGAAFTTVAAAQDSGRYDNGYSNNDGSYSQNDNGYYNRDNDSSYRRDHDGYDRDLHYRRSEDANYQSAPPPEEIVIYAPREYRNQGTSSIGAPIRDVAISMPVRFDDLDLASYHGAEKLNGRVREAADTLCRKINLRYITEGERDSCYRDTVANAQYQVDQAIDQARGGY